ncbi:MAG: Asp-tRNA(Asn)/Glu-tRNA(Gln) amidotransferase subunit GatA [Bacilli bacterium]|nr:Asp-tRNA(Asn)/Glu-tRNA(Gln) amidotransferase subunit GatA [Bacilli bacterium]
MDYLSKNIYQIHEALVNKEVTPLDLVIEALEKIKKDTNNAFEYIYEKEAIEIAEVLSKEEVEIDNPLWGIPFAIKDNFSTKDIPTCASSKLLEGYIPPFDSEVYTRLLNKKAIPIAKTTLDELAMGGTGSSGHKGKTFNPWDETKTRMIGGSSCGSAASCAAGIVPYSIGSDTGDSVRKPASYSALVGFKPTWGRISRYGLFTFSASLDHVAYFTRNVKDSALLLSVLSGRDDKDTTSSTLEVENYLSKMDEKHKPYKLAVIKDIYDDVSDKNIKSAFDKMINDLKEKGYKINTFSIGFDLAKIIYSTYYIISSAEATSNNANLDGIKFGVNKDADTYEEMLFKVRSEGFSDRIKRRFVIGSLSLLEENQQEIYLRALRARRLIVDTFNKILEDNDAIILPASPTVAPLFGDDIPKKSFNKDASIAENYLAFANLGGYPSITLPLGFENELPFGVNITSHHFTESKLLSIAKEVEEVTKLKDLVHK